MTGLDIKSPVYFAGLTRQQALQDAFSMAQQCLIDAIQGGRDEDARTWTRVLVYYARLLAR